MQHYTRQQLQGGIKYGNTTRVGNWNEGLENEEAALKDYIQRKERGELKLDKFQERMAIAKRPVELTTPVADGYVHFGSVVQLKSFHTGGVLAVDVGDKDPRATHHLSCAATVTKEIEPVARTTFILAKYKAPKTAKLEPFYPDDLVHYGQKVRLILNPLALNQAPGDLDHALYLQSQPTSTTSYAKHSRHQEVRATEERNYGAVWTVLCPRVEDRLVSEGVPLEQGAIFVLQHAGTAQGLLCDGTPYKNDFGTESEVCAHSATTKGKGPAPSLTEKGELSPNWWSFICSDTVATLELRRPGWDAGAAALEALREGVQQLGVEPALVEAALRERDFDGSGQLKVSDFVASMRKLRDIDQRLKDNAIAIEVLQNTAGLTAQAVKDIAAKPAPAGLAGDAPPITTWADMLKQHTTSTTSAVAAQLQRQTLDLREEAELAKRSLNVIVKNFTMEEADKISFLRRRKRLEKTLFTPDDDLTLAQQQRRRELWPTYLQLRQTKAGQPVYWKGAAIYVGHKPWQATPAAPATPDAPA
eukprot:jgi/Mesvir1/9684/Mv12165-RA.1